MVTKVHIAVQGTCTAGPDDNLYTMLDEIAAGTRQREFSKKLNRPVTGGGTAVWVRSPQGVYMIDTGDYNDRGILEKSLDEIEKQEKVGPVKAVKSIYHSHAHLDHNGNNDMFPHSYWMVPVDDGLVELMMGPKDTDAYNGFRKWYDGHRERGIISSKFTRYADDLHPGKPKGLTIFDAPGHDVVHKAFIIQDDDEMVIINHETGEEIKTDRIVFVGDALCDQRYLDRALDSDPKVQRTAIYGNVIPTEQDILNDQALRNRLDDQNMASIRKIIEEARKGGLMIFGHGGICDIKGYKR
jgi:glyoxylase-like metal-dependent hydrolase (beta-lactamase superfamily II)